VNVLLAPAKRSEREEVESGANVGEVTRGQEMQLGEGMTYSRIRAVKFLSRVHSGPICEDESEK